MAEYINMQQTEYDEVQTSMDELHQEVMEDIRKVMEYIRTVCAAESELYINQVSAKINTLLDCLENQILEPLELDFMDNHLASFIIEVCAYDKV